jgi:hypothetical protein
MFQSRQFTSSGRIHQRYQPLAHRDSEDPPVTGEGSMANQTRLLFPLDL